MYIHVGFFRFQRAASEKEQADFAEWVKMAQMSGMEELDLSKYPGPEVLLQPGACQLTAIQYIFWTNGIFV